jgi:predicted phosphodiesterase
MIYAVISDIHGNYPALKAVVDDAMAKGAEVFLLLGDYIRDTPTLDEVVDTIRTLPNCTAILGNGDIGVISLGKTKPEHCEFEQMLPNFWAYKNLSEQNLNYLKSLPESTDIKLTSGKTLHLSHSISLIHHKSSAFHSGDYARKMERSPFTIEEGIRNMQKASEEYSEEVAAYPGDICLFGHNHLQYSGSVTGKILLNPGSCGMPSDYDIRAPYAMINDTGDTVEFQLHRVEYDVEQTIKAVLEFNGFPHAQFWGKLRAAILKTGSDIPINRFWQHAREIGGGVFPMQNDLWRKAIISYEFDHNWSIDDWRRFGERVDVTPAAGDESARQL